MLHETWDGESDVHGRGTRRGHFLPFVVRAPKAAHAGRAALRLGRMVRRASPAGLLKLPLLVPEALLGFAWVDRKQEAKECCEVDSETAETHGSAPQYGQMRSPASVSFRGPRNIL
jgi:hypothetical protein